MENWPVCRKEWVRRREVTPPRLSAFIFQAGLGVHSADPLIPRPNLKGQATEEWDERVADLQYRDVYEYSVGHGIATHAEIDAEGNCHTACTCWIPSAEVELVAPAKILNVELCMDALAELADGPAAQKALGPFVKQYRDWIADQKKIPDPTGLQVLKKCRVSGRRHFCHPTSF